MFLGDVACEGGFGGECCRVAGLPGTLGHALDEVDCFQVLFEIGRRGEGCAAHSAARHEPLAGAGCGRCRNSSKEV